MIKDETIDKIYMKYMYPVFAHKDRPNICEFAEGFFATNTFWFIDYTELNNGFEDEKKKLPRSDKHFLNA